MDITQPPGHKYTFLSSGEHVLTTGEKKVSPAYCHFKAINFFQKVL